MFVENIPERFLAESSKETDLFLYDFKMTEDAIKTKVNLNMHMFSFLQEGRKRVHVADMSIGVNNEQSLVLKKGNWLWTELLDNESIYFCRLIFFSDKVLNEILEKYKGKKTESHFDQYFAFENDAFIGAFIDSLTWLTGNKTDVSQKLLRLRFEEIMLYLLDKYGQPFEAFLYSLVNSESLHFQNVIESNIDTSLTLDEIAFLCNMSLSTFKRNFKKIYGEAPGKWFREKRLLKAKVLLNDGKAKPSDIYSDLGYSNLSNFSNAFKLRFGVSPKDV